MMQQANLPTHIGIIMDGNGRWAKKRGLPRKMGHRAGASTFKEIARYANKIGLKYLTTYVFSTENWKRPKDEVDYLMNLLMNYLKDSENTLAGENVVIKAIGLREELSQELQQQINKTEEFTKNNTGITMNIALNYGGREEIIHAAKEIAQEAADKNISINDIDAKMFSSHLYTKGQPDPDFIIRTSGEERLSNFLLWQAAYSEFWFCDKLWPDFTVKDLHRSIIDFQNRNRRFGGV